MNGRTTVRALVGVAAVLALAGGGVAYAASDDTATTPGTQAAPSAPGRDGPPGDRGPHGFGHGPGVGGFAIGGADGAAAYLGLSQEELRTRLEAGRSLADIARAEGKSVDGLEAALVAAAKERLDRAVDDGWLGARARDEMLQRLREHVGELVQATGPRGGPHGRFDEPRGGCAPGRAGGPDARTAPDSRAPGESDEAPDQGSSTAPGSWRDAPAASVWS